MTEKPPEQRYQEADMLWYRVETFSNPEGLRGMIQWLVDQPFEISTPYDLVRLLQESDTYLSGFFDEMLGFTHTDHAMLFKLTWQGSFVINHRPTRFT